MTPPRSRRSRSLRRLRRASRRPTRAGGARCRRSRCLAPVPSAEPFELTPLSFEVGEDSGKSGVLEDPFLRADAGRLHRTAAEADADVDAVSGARRRAAPSPEVAPFPSEPAPGPRFAAAEEPPGFRLDRGVASAASRDEAAPPVADSGAPRPSPSRPGPTGRALADLYYAQGHYAEALQIYDDLVSRHPFDEDLKRMRRDAEARLLPAGRRRRRPPSPDPGLERRLARIRALKKWLSHVQAG